MYCLNAATVAGIVAGTAFGTTLLFLLCIATLIYVKWCRDKFDDTNKDRIFAKTRTDWHHARGHDKTHYVVYDNPSRCADQERGIMKFGQSTRKGQSEDIVYSHSQSTTSFQEEKCKSWKSCSTDGTVRRGQTEDNTVLCNGNVLGSNADLEIVYVTIPAARYNDPHFNITGDSINDVFVQDIPETKSVQKERQEVEQGDCIIGIKIKLENTSLETIKAIMTSASPLPITLEIQKSKKRHLTRPNELQSPPPLKKWVSFDDTSIRHNTGKNSSSESNPSEDTRKREVEEHQEAVESNPNKLTVTAEVNPIMKDQISTHSKNIKDPYSDLSYEERMQIIRLSYEDPDMSRSTPNLSISPTPPSSELGTIDGDKKEATPANECSSHKGPISPSKIPVPTTLTKKRRSSASGDSEILNNVISNGTRIESKFETQENGMGHTYERKNSLTTSTSGSSFTSSDDSKSDRVGSPDATGKIRGVNIEKEENEDGEEYAKLKYYQEQLQKQHQELLGLGMQIPLGQVGVIDDHK